jgi:hypothetical protein
MGILLCHDISIFLAWHWLRDWLKCKMTSWGGIHDFRILENWTLTIKLLNLGISYHLTRTLLSMNIDSSSLKMKICHYYQVSLLCLISLTPSSIKNYLKIPFVLCKIILKNIFLNCYFILQNTQFLLSWRIFKKICALALKVSTSSNPSSIY